MTLGSDDTPAGFLKLPAEIRNKIYFLTLVTVCVTIEDLHPDAWQAEKEAGHATRTSYKTKDHLEDFCYLDCGQPCILNNTKGMNAKISYTLAEDVTRPVIGMLALNRQIRAETVPIFYGSNVLCFGSMSALVPFLADRSELSLQWMRHFKFDMQIDPLYIQKLRHELRYEGLARSFSKLTKFPALNLRKLEVSVDDVACGYDWELKLDTKPQRWIHKMARNITKLDMLGVTLYSDSIGHLISDRMVSEDPASKLLWDFLAPKMLKKIQDEPHDAESLLKRRILVW